MFRRLVRERIDRGMLTALVILGYLAAWLAFGVAAHAADWWLHQWFGHSSWLQHNPWVFGAAPLIAAGLFQFSQLKSRCLDECRSPLAFVIAHWGDGERPRMRAFRTGWSHGAFCVGCCWALMLLMFAVGTGSVGWMLLLGAIMAIEKNVAWGRRISTPLGLALIAWGLLIAIDHTFSWQ
jgi:predicted metal-binding membrane protein